MISFYKLLTASNSAYFAGSLDAPELIEPTHQTWMGMAVPWAYLDKDLPSFPGNGPSPDEKIV
ncbi:MAG: hypothetical protein ABIF19_00220, partial [Planctomycetota bacterium]